MVCSRSRAALACAVIVLAFAAWPSGAERRAITERDLFKFVWVADPQIAPDGSRVAFVRVAVNEKRDLYETAIWLARTDGREPPRALTSGTRDSAPRWSPDGRRLAFVRSVEKDGRPQASQIAVMAMDGGEPRIITETARGANNPAWSPDGRTIAFIATDTAADLAFDKKDSDKQGEPPRQSDVRVITRAAYRANGIPGSGYLEPDRPSHIWSVAVPDGGTPLSRPKQLTPGEFTENDFHWSPDGSRLFFTSDRRREPYYYPDDSDLWAVSKNGGEPARIASIEGSIGAFTPSADGKRIAFVGTLHGDPERSYSQPDLFVVDLPDGGPRNLTAGYDFDVDGGVGGDQRAPRGQHPSNPVWSRDGRTLFVRVGEQGNANLVRVDVESGRVVPVTSGSQDLMSFTAEQTGQRLATVISTQATLGDLHLLDAATGTSMKLTTFNDELFGGLRLSEPEQMWYTSFDGRGIQGWILKPPSFDASKKYPLILEIHGGPHTAYGNTFTHEFQWLAARGYVVVFTNPRGSSNYGQEFGNVIQFKYPGDDYRDLMAGVDEILKKGYIDDRRLGVTGGSGGGLLTDWIVTQTTRFKAAVSQRDIADWASLWYTTDFTLFTKTWFHKAPFEDPAEFARRSPITYAAKIQTPMMFILGDEDWRTPASGGGEQLFRALKYLKRPAVMVRFPNENHELSRSGRPWHRVERLQHIAGWFDKWLLGKRVETYENPHQ